MENFIVCAVHLFIIVLTFCNYVDNIYLEKYVGSMLKIYFPVQSQVLMKP